MFLKDGIKQMFNNKKILVLTLFSIAFGTGIFMTSLAASDTVNNAMEMHFDLMFGNIDYTVHRNDGLQHVNRNLTIPINYTDYLRSLPNVEAVTARTTSFMNYYHTNDADKYWNVVAAIDVENNDEVNLGVGVMEECLSGLGNPNDTSLEEALNYTGVVRPVVISRELAYLRGYTVGDTVRIFPQNATKAYATASELVDLANNVTTAGELESSILENASRIELFTIVGIYVDGSEGIEKPKSDKELSFTGFMPHEETLYIRMNDSFQYVFNHRPNEVGFFLIDVEGAPLNFAETLLIDGVNVGIVSWDVRQAFSQYIDFVMLWVLAVMLSLSVLGWISMSMLIKMVKQMDVEAKMREIGIHRALGFKKSKIYEMLLGQITVTALMGTGVGLIIGRVTPEFFDLELMVQFLSYNKIFEVVITVSVYISYISIIAVLLSGILLPLIFGSYPFFKIRKWSIVETMNPVYMQSKTHQFSIKKNFKGQVKKNKFGEPKIFKYNPRSDLLWVLVVIGSFVLFYYSSTQIFSEGGGLGIDPRESWEWIALFAVGLLMFMLSIIKVGGNGIGGVSSFLSKVFKKRLGPVAWSIPKSIHANTRKIKVMLGLVLAGASFLTSLTVIQDTVLRGNDAANRSYLGGEIVIYDPMVYRSSLPSIANVEGVDKVTSYMHFTMDGYKFNPKTGEVSLVMVNSFGGFGGKHDNITENLNVVIIDPDEYNAVNPEIPIIHNEFYDPLGAVYEIEKPNTFENPVSFINRLKEPYTAILQDSLMNRIGSSVGQNVDLNINGFGGSMEIVGTASNLPGVPYMKLADYYDGVTNSGVNHGSMIISYATFEQLLDDFVGEQDIMIKNMSIQTEYGNDSIPIDLRGYTSGFMYESTRNTLDPAISAVNGVENVAWRFSTFAPSVPKINATYNASNIVYLQPNVTINNSGMVELPNRFYVINPDDEVLMSGSQENVVEAHSWFSNPFTSEPQFGWTFGPRNADLSQVLYTIDHYINDLTRDTIFNNNTLCAVNKYVTMYEDLNNMTWVYEMNVGDELFLEFQEDENNSAYFNFTVAATLDNHFAYFHDNGTEREGYKFSGKTLNYDFQLNDTELEDANFYDIFDADANVFYTTFDELQWMYQHVSGYPLSIQQIDDMRNHAYVQLESGYNASQAVIDIEAAITGAGVANYSVFALRQSFIDKLANVGSVAITIEEGYTEDEVMANLQEWYESNGIEWKVSNIGSMERYLMGSDVPVVGPVFKIFTTIAIQSMVGSAFGLATISYMNINTRNREFGTYKAIGFKNDTVGDMVFFETFIVTFMGVLLGMVSGLAFAFVLYQAVVTSALIPVAFSIPIWTLSSLMVGLLIVAVVTSKLVSKYMMNRPVQEILRSRW